jgi:prepilin-type N-terminal cleavage/methylation domain-containing protein
MHTRPTSRHRPDRGFTLVELMIVVVASAIIIAGAFALHQSFARQSDRLQKVAEVQQTLRVARLYIERQLRLAGSGFGTGTFKMPMAVNGVCVDRTVGGVEFHNLNDYNPPVFDQGQESRDDPDPDWFEFAYMDVNANPATLDHWASAASVEAVINNTQALADYQDCTSMISLGKPGDYTCVYGLKKVQDQSDHINVNPNGCKDNPCMDTSTGIPRSADDCLCNDAVAPLNPDYLKFKNDYAAAHPGLNASQLHRDSCDAWSAGKPINAMGPGLGGVRLFAANETTTWAPAGSAATAFSFPLLARAKVETAGYTWHQLTELIEDLQFEIFLDNGSIIGTQGNRRDAIPPTMANPEWSKFRAVRFTIMARSRTPVEHSFQQTLERYADRPACPRLGGTAGCPYTDGHVRRIVQGVVQLRNYAL